MYEIRSITNTRLQTRHRNLALSALLGLVAVVALILFAVTPTQAAPNNRVYWTDNDFSRIQRANLDGTTVENLISDLQFLRGIDLDVDAGKMYFVWVDGGVGGITKISKANLDRTGREDLITTGLGGPGFLALDTVEGQMYWTDDLTNSIRRANLDGTGVEDLVTTDLSTPLGIALDVAGGKMYWTDAGTDRIQRANLNGTEVEDLVTTGLVFPAGIALDVAAGKMYWTDQILASVHRADLDGANVEDIVTTGTAFPYGIDVDATNGKVYWTNRGDSTISRANLDGSADEDIVTVGLDDPFGIALEVAVSAPELLQVTDLQAVALDRDRIDILWTDLSVGEGGYEVERSVEGGPFSLLVELPPDSELFPDAGLAPETIYAYRVRAFVGGSFAEWSNITVATTFPDILPPTITLPWIVVNSAGDVSQRDGVMTLREAMLIATGLLLVGDLDVSECSQLLNGSFNGACSSDRPFGAAWTDTIVFEPTVFPVANPTVISLGSPLPELDTGGDSISAALGGFHVGVVVDGSTQAFDCFTIKSGGNSIQGLEITGCDNGVLIQVSGTPTNDNLIGGTGAGEGNVISGNVTGVRLDGPQVRRNAIYGNYIGTDAEGTAAMANIVGIYIDRAKGSMIGGVDPGAGNLISGNMDSGIVIDGGSNNVLANNLIGTDKTGLSPLPNGLNGVVISSADDNTIGTPETPNTIAYNVDRGVSILGLSSTGNTIRGNSIHSNGGIGIFIKFPLPKPNVDNVFTDGEGTLLIEGSFPGEDDTMYLVDFYSNQSGAQGENHLGAINITTDSEGFGLFDHFVSTDVAEGEQITATQTDPDGTTSRFSLSESVVLVPEVPPDQLNVRCLHSPIWPGPGDTITITAEALDGSLDSFRLVDNLEIWVNNVLSDSISGFGLLQRTIGPFEQGTFAYGCFVQEGEGTVFSGYRAVTVGDPLTPDVPVLYSGSPSTKIDIVFIADRDSYGGPLSSQFLVDVETLIRDGYYAEPLFLANQSKFNFWIAGDPGVAGLYDGGRSERNAASGTCSDGLDNDGDGLTDADDPNCIKCVLGAPGGWDTDLAFADSGAILHTNAFRDCANFNSRLFSTEPFSLRTAIHETGHSPFGLADEYCCDGGYFENSPFPNLYVSLANCQDDVPDGRTQSDCRKLSNTVNWWTSDPPLNDLMVSGGDPQALDVLRIDWMFGRCGLGDC